MPSQARVAPPKTVRPCWCLSALCWAHSIECARPKAAQQILDIPQCCVRSTLPPDWANMRSLTGLIANSNQLSGPLPDAWGANGSFPELGTANLVLYLGPWVMPCSRPFIGRPAHVGQSIV